MPKTLFIEAAYQVLKEKGEPLSAEEITKIALDKGLMKTTGKTPVATMGARIYMDMKTKGNNSLFTKVKRGEFGLKEWQEFAQKQEVYGYRKGSFKDAAYQVLKLENKPLSIQKITEIAMKRNLFTSSGKTPEATMGAQLYTDIKRLGDQSPFVQLGKNKFGLREWDISVLKNEIKIQEKETIISEKKRSIVGDPINFEGLIYGPLNENGVIFLFSKIHDKLEINIEAIQATFPDAIGRRKTTKGWEDVWIEFEYKSSHFKIHKHDPSECDLIVCWEHDWKECPIDVIELKSVIQKLKG
ncbi:MAG: winged helix-turn-helix domain-containing protein [Candidatus Syntrophosphaera sp.]|jgi:DNA-directed RNA polymerase delta subunit|nr:winged helix-turn-helix domain-containing protein [Candidatus Cloacimonadota bacterium]MDY0111348.1 winged helix-turn-helix domain-containing protein [Candidatus Syntrophosphaera sp.]